MAKHIAENIVGILNDAENDDLELFYHKYSIDWKYRLRQHIQYSMITSIDCEAIIDMYEYLNYVKIDDKLLDYSVYPLGHCSYHLRTDIKIQTINDPDIIYCKSGTFVLKILSPHLQAFVDYCKSLKLGVHLFHNPGVGYKLLISWSHWNNKSNDIIVTK